MMQSGPGKGGKGEAGGSPTRMEQGFVMPSTVGAYDESLYRSAQQFTTPVPPSTPSSSSRVQGKGGMNNPEQQETANGQAYPSAGGPPGMPGMQGVQGACQGKGGACVQDSLGCGSFGPQRSFQGFSNLQGVVQPPGIFQNQPNVGPQMFQNMMGGQANPCFGPQIGSQFVSGGPQFSGQFVSGGPQCGGPNLNAPCGASMCQGSSQIGSVLGGLTPQAQRMQQVLSMSQGLSSSQLVTLMQGLQEQMRSQARMNPEHFGDIPVLPENVSMNVPGLEFSRDGDHNNTPWNVSNDVFSRSEKWLGSPPKPCFENWSNRESEVVGWNQYLLDLSAWAAQASMEFSAEIQQCARRPNPISLEGLTPARRARAMRLHAILKSSLQEHARTSNLVNAFGEGVSLDDPRADLNLSQLGNGFELLRQLTAEYSLRTRAEALSIRSQFSSKSFVLSPKETSPTSIVSDVIRRLDLESARFNKLLGTLPTSVDVVGLQLSDADLLIILMRSLPDAVKSYTIHHSVGDTYQSYRTAARQWEMQQRMFLEQMGGSSGSKDRRVNEVMQSAGSSTSCAGSPATEWFSIGEDFGTVDAVSTDKCQKCGSRKHSTPHCQIDLSKTKCFRCQQFGHVGMNCPNGKGKGSNGVSFGEKGKGKVNKGSHFDKGKGKSKKGKGSKGFGKKGKLNHVGFNDDDWWWYAEDWSTDWENPENCWNVDQLDWHGNGWDEWSYQQYEEWKPDGNSGCAEPKGEPSDGTEEKNVGSLVIHALTSDSCEMPRDVGRLQLLDVGSKDALCSDCSDVSMFSQSFNFSSQNVSKCGEHGSSFGFGFDGSHTDCSFVSFTPGLISRHEGMSDASLDVDVSELLSPEPRRFCLLRPQCSTCLSHPDTLDGSVEFSMYADQVCPILSELSCASDAGWWLLDSGAAVTVVAESHFPLFQTELHQSPDVDRFRAANGSKVNMKGVASIVLGFSMLDPGSGKSSWKTATLQAMVGNTNHNILSTTALCRSGWQFSQWEGGAELKHSESGEIINEIVEHAGCPWIRMSPVPSPHEVSHVEPNANKKTGLRPIHLSPLSPAVEAELEQHRRQGHFPHHPRCVECSRGRGVFQHRRRGLQNIEVEVQADFAFITKNGEVDEEDSRFRNMKVLVLTELLSGCVGFVMVSENVQQVNSYIEKWLDSFGLSSSMTSVILHSDDEKAVGGLVIKATRKYIFQVRRAAPQQHRSIGAAERAVRKLKESLAVLRADINKHGVDIRYSYTGLRDVVTYLALMNNHFGRAGGTDLSPLETSAGRSLSKPVVSLFGSLVIAEIPDSIRQYSPNETRSIQDWALVLPWKGSYVWMGVWNLEDFMPETFVLSALCSGTTSCASRFSSLLTFPMCLYLLWMILN